MASIRFTCASCGKELKAAVEHAGVKVKCPSCGTIQNVPEDVFEAEAVTPAAPQSATYGVTPAPPRSPAETDDRRPCPACGEMIKSSAVKCRFCGEIFDERLARAERKRAGSDDTDLAPVDWVLAILCSGIGCIVSIVYIVQGKPKGWKMLGICFLVQMILVVIRVALEAGMQGHR